MPIPIKTSRDNTSSVIENAPHHPEVTTFPHHKHVVNFRNQTETIEAAIALDLRDVLREIVQLLYAASDQ